ncbi:hypothetical protein F383_04619 [Gossypium arboreum]|uniref:Uncharacterized protein n=1 Tax=Gossypium arboreum TaxID=29729 RepID=A0A0B0P8B0_GOSAR|nr:hypothetical protein F383_04619 [Gossypium arboreum]
MLHTVEVVYPTHQLSIPYLFELMFLFTSNYMSHTYIVHHLLRTKVCHTINITRKYIYKRIQDLFYLGPVRCTIRLVKYVCNWN